MMTLVYDSEEKRLTSIIFLYVKELFAHDSVLLNLA
jgi:hypothetical protein